MLLDIRETIRNSKPLKYTLIVLICIPFVLFGIGSYFSGGRTPAVATVNGQDITQAELDAATQRQRQQLARLFGGQLPAAFADETALRRQALEQLVTQRVLADTVETQRFAVGDDTLGRAIRELPAFQVDGRFDSDAYESQLRASGLSVAAFEQSFRNDTALNQFRSGITDTSFLLPGEAERLDALARQTRTVDAVRYDLETAKATIVPTDEEIRARFEKTPDEYVFPERAKVDWIELDAAALADGIDVTDQEARARYDENRASYVRPEQRTASHILLTLDAGASEAEVEKRRAVLEQAKTRLANGEPFADLARELSEDVGSAEAGGSLGTVTPGAMAPEFEQAVFALAKAGDVSDPVRTDFGLHLIRLDSVTPESGQPFEEVKDQIVAQLKSERADREFYELRDQLAELAFEQSTSLAPAAEATGLGVKSSDWIDKDTAADAGPVLSSPAVLAAIEDPEVREAGNNSEPIDIGERRVVVLRVTESEGPRPKALEDVRERIVDELKTARAGERLDALAASAVEALAGGTDIVAVADGEPLAEAMPDVTLERQSTRFDRSVVEAVFALPHPTADVPRTATATLADGDRLAYVLRSVDVPVLDAAVADGGGADGTADAPTDPPADAAPTRPTVVAGADPQLGNVEFEAVLGSLSERADVERREAALTGEP